MSKVSFRARALDSNKPLPLYYEEELPDLSEYVAINRTVPQMPTGMEKEEESESHLQKVINARQNLKDSSTLVIPIPEPAIPVVDHSDAYEKVRLQPNYIRMPGLGPDEELPDYDLDSEDEEWLSVQSRERPLSPIHFERMMDRLEKGSGNTVLSERDAQVLLKDDDDLVMAVYDYWLAKRLRLSRPLIPSVKNERRDGTGSSNPYLAFRKRTEKMQTRKNRKNDEQAYMHMLKLKRDLTRSVTLIDLVKEREQRKYDHALIQAEIFRKRYLLQDWSGSLIASLKPHNSTCRRLSTPDGRNWDHKGMSLKSDYFDDNDGVIVLNKLKKKKRKGPVYNPAFLDHESPLATIGVSKHDRELKETDKTELNDERIDVEDLDGPFTFRRKIHLHYHKSQPFGEWPWDQPLLDDEYKDRMTSSNKRFCFPRVSLNRRHLGFSRRRIGRGGRSVWDFVPESYIDDEVDIFNTSDNATPTANSLTSSLQEQVIHNGIILEDPIDVHVSDRSRCPHFCPASPKSTKFVDFEFTYLPFIDPSSYACPELNKGYSQFAGQTLNSDEDGVGVSSFSSLPTSQFTLRPCINLVYQLKSGAHNQVSENREHVDVSTDTDEQKQPNGKFLQLPSDLKLTSSTLAENLGCTAVPSTHLSSLESTGLPVQIHVDNLTHLPRKDSKIAASVSKCSSENTTLPANAGHQSSPFLSRSLSNLATTLITTNALNTGATTVSSNHSDSTSAIQPMAPTMSQKPQPQQHQQIKTESMLWFKDCPSSNVVSLNSDKISKLGRNKCTHPTITANRVTARFKIDSTKSDPPLQQLAVSASAVPTHLTVSPSSPIMHPLLSNQMVTSLISDSKKVARDKRHFTGSVTHTAAGGNGITHQNSSPNGNATVELNHNCGKLSNDPDKDIKHTVSTRTVMNNHTNLVEAAGSCNVLVKLTSGTPPEVT